MAGVGTVVVVADGVRCEDVVVNVVVNAVDAVVLDDPVGVTMVMGSVVRVVAVVRLEEAAHEN